MCNIKIISNEKGDPILYVCWSEETEFHKINKESL